MSGKTFGYLADRAAQHPVVVRKSQMRKISYMNSSERRPLPLILPRGCS
jgi:hypothetical protein